MSQKSEIKGLATRIAKDMKTAAGSGRIREVNEFLERNKDAALAIIDLLQSEVERKRPDEFRIHAYLLMFGQALELLRYQIERGYEWSEQLLEAIQLRIVIAAGEGLITGTLLMSLLSCFREARLEAGEELASLAAQLFAEEAEEDRNFDPAEIETVLGELAEALEGGAFDVYGQLAEFSLSLPPDFRKVMLELIASSPSDALRDTVVLSLLDPAPEVRRQACEIIAKTASPSPASSLALRRMTTLRDWLPETERPALDAAIERLRRKGVDSASWPSPKRLEILATSIDGAGAQSAFAVMKEGRKQVLAGLLVKQGQGIADAWCLRNQSESEIRTILDQLGSTLFCVSVTLDFVETLLRHYLAVGLRGGRTPPVGLLDFVETIGLTDCRPADFGLAGLFGLMEKEIEPEHLEPDNVRRVLEDSADWLETTDFAESWVEQDAAVDGLMRSQGPGVNEAARVQLILDRILDARRDKWTERFLWMAYLTKSQADRAGPWEDFFVLAREIDRGRPLTEIPIMSAIAEESLYLAEPS